jgi:hypothetical protein
MHFSVKSSTSGTLEGIKMRRHMSPKPVDDYTDHDKVEDSSHFPKFLRSASSWFRLSSSTSLSYTHQHSTHSSISASTDAENSIDTRRFSKTSFMIDAVQAGAHGTAATVKHVGSAASHAVKDVGNAMVHILHSTSSSKSHRCDVNGESLKPHSDSLTSEYISPVDSHSLRQPLTESTEGKGKVESQTDGMWSSATRAMKRLRKATRVRMVRCGCDRDRTLP